MKASDIRSPNPASFKRNPETVEKRALLHSLPAQHGSSIIARALIGSLLSCSNWLYRSILFQAFHLKCPASLASRGRKSLASPSRIFFQVPARTCHFYSESFKKAHNRHSCFVHLSLSPPSVLRLGRVLNSAPKLLYESASVVSQELETSTRHTVRILSFFVCRPLPVLNLCMVQNVRDRPGELSKRNLTAFFCSDSDSYSSVAS